MKIGSTSYFPSGNLNLLNGGRFIGGANASFDISGDVALSEIKFDESSQANQTLKNFTLTKKTGLSELKSNLRVTAAFTLNEAASSFAIGPHTLTLNGTVTNIGSFQGSANSTLLLGGNVTTNYTIKFLQTNEDTRSLKKLSIARVPTSIREFIISNNLNVVEELDIATLNRLRLGANTTLTLKGSVSGTGDIAGSTTGRLIIDNAAAAQINPLKIFSGTDFKTLNIKRTAGVVLDAGFTVRDTLNIENTGKLTLPANVTFTLGVGSATPTFGAFTGDGMFAGSATSNLSIRGTSAIVGIRFSQTGTENVIRDFTIEKSTGSVNLLNSNLSIDRDLNIADNNNLSIGSGTLTLKGLNLNASGEFTGSANSNLAITGSGTTDRSIRFNQANALNRTLKTYNQTRNVTITLGNRLDITDRADVSDAGAVLESAGNLTLLSTATTTSSIGPLTSGDITGNVNIQSYFTGGYRTSKGISSPINDFSNPAPPKNVYQQLKDYILVTGPGGTANGFDAGGGNPFQVTIKKYNEAADPAQTTQQFTPVAAITEKVKTGEGFFALFRGDRNINPSQKLNAPFTTPEPITVTYTGLINKGDITVDLTHTEYAGDVYNGFNLIGNPYPATIDWDGGASAITKTNIANTLYVYRPDGTFAVWANGESTNGGTSFIQAGQAFYVPALSGGGQVVFKEASKVPSASPMRFLSVPGKERLAQTKEVLLMQNQTGQSAMPVGKLRMTLDDGINKDETLVVFREGSEAKLTSEDAVYFGAGSTVSLASLSADEKRITINFMPEVDQVERVKLFISATSAGKLNLNFTDLSAAGDMDVLLKDNHLNTLTDVKNNQKYEFSVDKSNNSTFGAGRFEILFQPPVTLPIKLISFTAKKIVNGEN